MSSTMYQNHATDTQFERKGVWVDYGGFRVLVAKAGGANRKYLQMIERETKPVRRAMAAGSLTEERAKPIMIKVFSETIVHGWQVFQAFEDDHDGKGTKAQLDEGGIWKDGIEQPDGSLGKFTKENVVAVLTNLPAVFGMIKLDAMADDIYLATVREEEAGN